MYSVLVNTDEKELQELVKERDGKRNRKRKYVKKQGDSVADPDPNPDPYVYRPPGSGSGSISQRYGSLSFYYQEKIVRKTLIPTVL